MASQLCGPPTGPTLAHFVAVRDRHQGSPRGMPLLDIAGYRQERRRRARDENPSFRVRSPNPRARPITFLTGANINWPAAQSLQSLPVRFQPPMTYEGLKHQRCPPWTDSAQASLPGTPSKPRPEPASAVTRTHRAHIYWTKEGNTCRLVPLSPGAQKGGRLHEMTEAPRRFPSSGTWR